MSDEAMGSNGGSPSKPGPVMRTIAKLRHKGHDDEQQQQQHAHFHYKHEKTEDYAESVAYALVREIFEYMNSSEGQLAIKTILTTQAKVAASLAVSEGAKEASRLAAQQAVMGSYDAAESKYMEMWVKLPKIVKIGAVPVVIFYVVILSMALLVSLWRFALFGLH